MTEPVSLNLTALQAVVTWVGTDGQTNHLYRRDDDPTFQVALDVRYNTAQGQPDSGNFRLRVPVHLKSSPQEKTSLLLCIRPERIASLLYQQCDDSDSSSPQVDSVDPLVRAKLGFRTVCLKFVMNSPPDMVVPSGVPLVPSKLKPHGRQMYLLTHLAQTTSFSIWLRAQDLSSPSLLQGLTDAITDPAREVQSSAEADDIASLYSGQGGRILDEAELSTNATKAVPSLPPSYANVGAPPPMAPLDEEQSKSIISQPLFRVNLVSPVAGPSTSTSKLRKRLRSSDIDESRGGSDVESIRKDMMDILHRSRQEDRAFMTDFVRTEIQKVKSEVMDEIQASKREMTQYIDRRTDELDYRLNDLEKDIEHTNNRVDVQVDEAVLSYKIEAEDEKETFKSELREFVTDQLDEAQERAVEDIEERVMERLNGASVSVEKARLRLE